MRTASNAYIGRERFEDGSKTSLAFLQAVDLGGHNKIALGQAVDLVRPHRDFSFAPRKKDIGMMSLFFGQFSNLVYEIQGLFEIGKLKLTRQMMLGDHVPLRNGFEQVLQFSPRDRRHPAAAGNTFLIR